MARLIQVCNHLQIKKYTYNDSKYYVKYNDVYIINPNRYFVQAPDGRILVDDITKSEARIFCRGIEYFPEPKPRPVPVSAALMVVKSYTIPAWIVISIRISLFIILFVFLIWVNIKS